MKTLVRLPKIFQDTNNFFFKTLVGDLKETSTIEISVKVKKTPLTMSFGHHTKGEIQDIHEVRFLKKTCTKVY